MEYISTKKDKRTFRDLVLTHMSKILELSCEEFRSGYTQRSVKDGYNEEKYVPDGRKRMSQAIEFFSIILQPFYNEKMEKKAKEIKEELESNMKELDEGKMNREDFIVRKLRLMTKLFEALNFLLNDKDYLREESYEDSADWEAEE